MDGEYDEPMAFANVLIKGTTTGTSTDFEGKYILDVEPGVYTLIFSYVGYNTVEVSGINVSENEDKVVNTTLETNSLSEIVITTTARKNTESAVLDIQKKSVTLLDGLSIESIKKTGAGDIAAAVKSVPGVSVQGGKYVYVRGLGDRYTKSILNGVDIPGLDPDRNTIQMDIFPTNILENVIVIKSASAEYPADFTGGVINIVTKDFPTRKTNSISAGFGYNPEMHFNNNYLSYKGSPTDFIGLDNGDRNIPVGRYEPIPGYWENDSKLTDMTRSFNPELKGKNKTSFGNFDFGFTSGNQFDVGENKMGYQFSLSYKNNTTFYKNRFDGIYQKNPDASVNELSALRLTNGSEGVNNVILNAIAGIVFKTDNSKYKLTALRIQNGESSAGYFTQLLSQDGVGGGFEPIYKDALLYTERAVTNLMLNGKHNSVEGDWIIDWKISPTFSKVFDKDHRISPLQETDEGEFVISPSAATFPIRIWRDLDEMNLAGKLDFLKKHTFMGNPSKLKFGAAYTFKRRSFYTDDFTFEIKNDFGDMLVKEGNTDNLLKEENLWTPETNQGTLLRNSDIYDPANSYEGQQRVAAAYVSNEFKFSEQFNAVVGVRLEKFESYYSGIAKRNNIPYELDNEKIIDELDIFPSANLIYSINDKSNFRTSYSMTTARPSFKEASTAQVFDPITNRLFIGNLDIKPSYINNFDLRYENFGENGEMFAISGFYKKFRDPIELTFFVTAPEQLTPQNLGEANVLGAEFEFRKGLGFILEDLSNLKFNLNLSLIKSELEMSEPEYNLRISSARDGETVSRKRELQGQSPYLINAGLDYSNNDIGLKMGLFYNVQGETLEVVGAGVAPDVYMLPFNSLNFNSSKSFGKEQKSSIELKISNLLGSERRSVYKSYGISKNNRPNYYIRQPFTEISLGYSYKF